MGLAYLYAGRGGSSTEGRHFPAPVVGAFSNLGAQRPGGPACPAGVPISPEKWGERGPGASPLDPRFLWPLVPTRWVWGWLALVRSKGCCLRYAKTNLGRIFEGKYAGKHFCEKRFPNQAHLPKAFPSGGRCPSAHTGADEGATGLPNGAGEERRRGDRSLLLQGKVGYRIAPSSVTFGDSFPPRGSLWVVQPYPKKRPKSGHVHGHRNSPSTGTM